jgi:hypothetical protein
MNQFIEKRQHIRLPLTFVTVDVISKSNKIESSETCSVIDISENGMKIISRRLYKMRQSLHITFVLPGNSIPIHAESIVIYQQPHNSLMYTGIQFVKLDLVEFTLLKKYIDHNTEQN